MREMLSAQEVADLLHIHIKSFYRMRGRLHAQGMPQPTGVGRYPYHRASMQAWLARHHPLAPKAPAANDSMPGALEREPTIEEERAAFAAYCARELARTN